MLDTEASPKILLKNSEMNRGRNRSLISIPNGLKAHGSFRFRTLLRNEIIYKINITSENFFFIWKEKNKKKYSYFI